MTRDDLERLRGLDIDFGPIGLFQDGDEDFAYFCTPVGAEYVGRTGCDGVHFILLPGDERVFCVDPDMGEPGTYVLPVAEDLRQCLSFVLFCGDTNPIAQIWWLTEERFRGMLEEDAAVRERGELPEYFAKREAALAAIGESFQLAAAEPYARIKALQDAFDQSVLNFSDEYYDALDLERPQ